MKKKEMNSQTKTKDALKCSILIQETLEMNGISPETALTGMMFLIVQIVTLNGCTHEEYCDYLDKSKIGFKKAFEKNGE